MVRNDLRAQGDRDLAERILADSRIQAFVERFERERTRQTRRHLLGTAVRLTPSIAPVVDAVVQHCREALEVEAPVELYVLPDPRFNAMSYGAEDGRMFIGLTSSLLESFTPAELRFVMGHELGHQIFGHHDIPVGALVHGNGGIGPRQAIDLFRWQRYAEISADRAGLACVGAIEPTARAFFKIASGLKGDGIAFDLETYLEQIGDLQAEVDMARTEPDKSKMRSDWFASHPFSPLRVRAAQLAARSELIRPGGMSLPELELEVQGLMAIMDPSYLVDKSPSGEAMRQLLFAGGVLVAAVDGNIKDTEIGALGEFLGEQNLPSTLNPEALRADLDRRVEFVKKHTTPLLRAHVIRDLCAIAMADGHASRDELKVIRDIAQAVEVESMVVDQTIAETERGLD